MKLNLPPIFFSIATRVIRSTQRLVGASTVGVRAIVLKDDKVLLVKHTYTPGWHFPGGGVNDGEDLETAIIRELKEETGVIVKSRPKLFGAYFHKVRQVDDYPILYIVKDFDETESSDAEIAEVKWFSYDNLPYDTSGGTRRRLKEYFEKAARSNNW